MRPTTLPTIDISGLSLRPIELRDASAWYAYLSMPSTVEHTSWHLTAEEDLTALIARYQSADPASALRFALQDNTSGLLVGSIGLHTLSLHHRSAEIAYDVHPKLCGTGIATACCRALLEWAFSAQGLIRVQATVMDTNLASIRVLEKSGFEREGKLKSYRLIRQQPRDYWMYAAIKQ